MGEAAADGAAAAEFAVADPREGHTQERDRGRERVSFELALADGGADVEGVAGKGQGVQACDGIDIHQERGAA